MTLGQIKEVAAALLPGCVIRRRLFWRFVLVYRMPVPECKAEAARDYEKVKLVGGSSPWRTLFEQSNR